MEFEELKKVWDNQNNRTMYTIDETALHGIVTRKKKGAIRKARFMEYFLVGANLIAGATILITHTLKESGDIYAYLMGALMIATAMVILVFRGRRRSRTIAYERTISGDLKHALSDARYVVRMSRTMQYYFLLVGILMALSKGFDDWTHLVLMIGFVGFVLYASTWEHKWYEKKLRDLQDLRKVLERDS